jgi:hypothetical protein
LIYSAWSGGVCHGKSIDIGKTCPIETNRSKYFEACRQHSEIADHSGSNNLHAQPLYNASVEIVPGTTDQVIKQTAFSIIESQDDVWILFPEYQENEWLVRITPGSAEKIRNCFSDLIP